ncbi:alpha-1,2-mannosyltransferase (Kre5) [Ascosphaera pollenicola]|nr:alpha-1,2-mannosyltransferase (Kre5) [Ascosphaera pollenicola]
MPGQKIDGTALAASIRASIAAEISSIQTTNPRFKPRLTIIQVGARPDSNVYVRMKLKAAAESSIDATHAHFPADISQAELLRAVHAANNDASVHGILVQLPLPPHISEHAVTSAVSDEKDVDGFGVASIGELAKRGGEPLFMPCTPLGCMALLKSTGVQVAGKHAVVLGRSDIVGSPVSYMLKNADATVTIAMGMGMPRWRLTSNLSSSLPRRLNSRCRYTCNPSTVSTQQIRCERGTETHLRLDQNQINEQNHKVMLDVLIRELLAARTLRQSHALAQRAVIGFAVRRVEVRDGEAAFDAYWHPGGLFM